MHKIDRFLGKILRNLRENRESKNDYYNKGVDLLLNFQKQNSKVQVTSLINSTKISELE